MQVDSDITLSDQQAAAVKAVLEWYKAPGQQEFYLAGFAGVGKSTIAKFAIEELKAQRGIKRVPTAAYTGKAASVLRRKGVSQAQTIHSLIYVATEDEETGQLSFVLSEESDAANADLIVLDECSMVDEALANDLRHFEKKILVLGDPGQLPPVNGQGAFTSREPDFFLTEIHRQSAESPILELATIARQGKRLPVGYDREGVRVLPLNKETQNLIYGEETQAICGLNRVRWTYNRRIRSQRGFEGEAPQPGERIICCKNNRNKGLFNGGMGVLKKLKRGAIGEAAVYHIDAVMEDLTEMKADLAVDPFHFANHFNAGTSTRLRIPEQKFEEFDFGYVLTCHKGQGSSWDHVTVIDDSAAFRDEKSRWAYTAITRAETGLTFLTRQ